MKLIVVFLFAFILGSWVEQINSNPLSTWKAREYDPLLREMRVKSLMKKLPKPAMNIPLRKLDYDPKQAVPDTFDARDVWGDLILPVRDQQQCGSCWAFSVTETMGDRFGIVGNSHGVLAPQDLVSCDVLDLGCEGGSELFSWFWADYAGVTTEDCMPYTSGNGDSGVCPSLCTNGSTITRYYSSNSGAVDVSNFQTELQSNGPFELTFEVYDDFMDYTSGVYQHTYGDLDGGHAVLLVGWGTENGVPYWLVQNSWGTNWGLDGFFKIIRGTDECGIEDGGYAASFS